MGSPKRQRQSEPTTLMSLGDDMLAEILRRLPSQPSLVRAAFACPRLRSVALCSSVVTSPTPLLGYFISVRGGDIPSFHRALLRSDRDVAGIVRRGDFRLANFEDYEWRLMDCRHGLLLLTSDRCMAVFDPVSSSRLSIPHFMSNGGGKSSSFHCFLLASCDATSFRVLCLQSTGGGRVRAHVYSSCTGEWCSHSLAPKGIKPPRRGDHHYIPMYAGGRIYWRIRGEMVVTLLDVGSMEFSHIALPDKLLEYPYALGETEDGTTCLVAMTTSHGKRDMRVWFLKEGSGSSLWEQQWRVDSSEWDLLGGYRETNVCNVTNGIVLLSMGYKSYGLRYLAFRLKDTPWEGNPKRQSPFLADFFTTAGWVHPYFMAWPHPNLKAIGSIEKGCTSEQEDADASKKKKHV